VEDSDDGYDFISQEVPVTIEDSFAMSNGRGSDGNGNGFKIGSSQTASGTSSGQPSPGRTRRGLLRQPFDGRQHLVQQHVLHEQQRAVQHARQQLRFLGNVTGTIILTGSQGAHHAQQHRVPDKNADMDGVDTMFNTGT
jgi:hypothetical protein